MGTEDHSFVFVYKEHKIYPVMTRDWILIVGSFIFLFSATTAQVSQQDLYDDDNQIHIESNNDGHDNGANSKEIEEKGGLHFLTIVIITMLVLNASFIIYCCIAECSKTKKKKSKYVAVSGDEFQFDESNLKLDIEDAEISQNKEQQRIDADDQ